MRLLSFHIDQFKIFDNFMIEFDPNYSTSVIIGKNGSGKTTFIECLVEIFSHLYRSSTLSEVYNQKFPFDFELKYILRTDESVKTVFMDQTFTDHIGMIISFTQNKTKVQLFQGDNKYDSLESLEKFLNKCGEDISYFLPANLVVYYSGISDILYNNFKKFQKKIIIDSLDSDAKIKQQYYYFLSENFPAILVALLSYQFGDIPEILEKKYGITGFEKIELALKKPHWAKPNSTAKSFWGARGDLATFLARISAASGEVELSSNKISLNFNSKEQLQHLWEYYGNEKIIFEYLVSLQANDLIEDIGIKLFKSNLSFEWQRLSEGEKQLLTILGLNELVAADNSLFLLDEPDTYLHPEWQREFIQELMSMDKNTKNYLIITSHSPNIVSGFHKSQLKIFKSLNNKTVLRNFTFNPYGKKIDGILIDFFDVDGLRYKQVDEDILILRRLIIENKFETNEFKNLYDQYKKEIGRDDSDILAMELEIAKRKKNEKNK